MILKYVRLYKSFVAFSISRSLEFRFDFTFRIFMDIIYYIVKIYFFKVIFLHTNLLAGWTEEQVLIFATTFLVVDAIQMTVLSNNTWILPQLVNKGELDYYLLRPVSSLFFLSFRDFAVNSFFNFLMVFGFLIYLLCNYSGALPILNLFLYGILIINGFLIFYCLRVLLLLPVFWTHSGRGMEMLFWTSSSFMERPDRIFKGFLRGLLTTVLPFSLIASFPARVLFGEEMLYLTLYCFGISALFLIILKFTWNQALKNYSSASS